MYKQNTTVLSLFYLPTSKNLQYLKYFILPYDFATLFLQ